MPGLDAGAVRVAFIQRQLDRALELAAAARANSDERALHARTAALHILMEFQRYCEWCSGLLSEADRIAFERALRRVELAIGRGQNAVSC